MRATYRMVLGGAGAFRGKLIGTCHFVVKIGTILPCHYLKNSTHNSVSWTRIKVQSHKIKMEIVVDGCWIHHIVSSSYK